MVGGRPLRGTVRGPERGDPWAGVGERRRSGRVLRAAGDGGRIRKGPDCAGCGTETLAEKRGVEGGQTWGWRNLARQGDVGSGGTDL